MHAVQQVAERPALNLAISESMASLYARVYGHDRTTATTYINDNVVVCILEDILSTAEGSEVAAGDGVGVIDRRVAFQADMQDEFTAEIERLTDRHVVAFLSGNQSSPGIACELFFLETPPEPASSERVR